MPEEIQEDNVKIDLEKVSDASSSEGFYNKNNSYLIEEKPENEEKSTIKAGKSSIDGNSNSKKNEEFESDEEFKVCIWLSMHS